MSFLFCLPLGLYQQRTYRCKADLKNVKTIINSGCPLPTIRWKVYSKIFKGRLFRTHCDNKNDDDDNDLYGGIGNEDNDDTEEL